MPEIEQGKCLTPQERCLVHNFKFDIARECRRYGPLPPIRGIKKVPECLISITDLKKTNWPGAFVHSFKDDYKFDTSTNTQIAHMIGSIEPRQPLPCSCRLRS